jgi:hypothetical protein
MARTRSSTSIDNPKSASPKKLKLERGEQSRAEPSDGKDKRREEEGEYRAVFVISSDDDVPSSADHVGSNADDVLLSEELQIQEVLFMTMRSNKDQEDFPLVTEEEEKGNE